MNDRQRMKIKEMRRKGIGYKAMAAFADVWYTANGAEYGRNHHYNSSRYHMLNYHATFTKDPIEFRSSSSMPRRTASRTASTPAS